MAKAKASRPAKASKKPAAKKAAAKSAKAAKGTSAKSKAPKSKAAAAKKSARPARAKKKVAPALTAEAKQRLLKPISSFDGLVERLADTWREHGRMVRVPGLTAAKLASLLRKAGAAAKKEDAVRARLEARLRPLADARLQAEHDAWKAALDVYAMIKAAARTDPAILTPFDFFAEALQKRRSGAEAPDGPADEPGAPPA